MIRSSAVESADQRTRASLDLWLSFDRDTDAHYERDHGRARAAHLRRAIVVGLIIFNMYNFTGLLLMPDIMLEQVVLRGLVVTPASFGLAYLVYHVGPRLREWLVTLGMVNAYAIPVFLFWLTDHPLGNYTFGEFVLTLVFGNMLLTLRFRQAVIFTFCAFGISLFGLLAHRTLDPVLFQAFVLQLVTSCTFTLYGNYLIEKRRCTDFVISRTALLRANAAENSAQRMTELSRTDTLTGLPNRRYLDETLQQWLVGPSAVAVLMIDIDHFKLFNDSLGHPAGDDCLRQVARVFRDATEKPDAFCARFGGEEFTIAFKDIDELEAVRLTSRLVQAIAALNITHPGRRDGIGVVTVSVGLTIKPAGPGADKETVLKNADAALYRAKKNGRNGYAIHEHGDDPEHAAVSGI